MSLLARIPRHLRDPKVLRFAAEHAHELPSQVQQALVQLVRAESDDPVIWEACGRDKCDGQPHEGFPWRHARPEQVPDDGPWSIWGTVGGRGLGKTRAGAEWVYRMARENPGCRIAIVAPTFGDARDTCIEGESGLLAIVPEDERKAWNKTYGRFTFRNGSRVQIFSGDEPDRLRGPQFHFAWCDELAAFRYEEAWHMLQFGLRLGDHPRVFVTTTPKPTKLIRDLLSRNDGSVVVKRGSTFDNAANLAASALSDLKRRYDGTRLGRQELYGELLTDVPGALATMEELDATRLMHAPYDFDRIVTAVDVAVTNTESSDATGITVTGKVGDHAYLLADVSLKADVEVWAMRAIETSIDMHSGLILYEANQGGDAIGIVLQNALAKYNSMHKTSHLLPIRPVTATLSKFDRALPLQMALQQGRYHLVGVHNQLELELTTWVPLDEKGKKMPSPNSLDSAVHGFREVMEMNAGGSVKMKDARLKGRR